MNMQQYMNCVFAVAKPAGISSAQLTMHIRRMLQRHWLAQLSQTSNPPITHAVSENTKLESHSPAVDSGTILPQLSNLSLAVAYSQDLKKAYDTAKSTNCASVKHLSEREKPSPVKKVKAPFFRVGHGGTLDVEATGVLVVGVGQGCKLLDRYLTRCNKTYEVSAQLGSATDTFDSSGQVIPHLVADYSQVTEGQLAELLPQYVGDVYQRPPVFSALRVDGQRGYQYARDQVELDWANLEKMRRPARLVHIKSCELASFDQTKGVFSLRVETGSGVYIRSLIDDIGHALGCFAHISTLSRTVQKEFVLHADETNDPECVALQLDKVTVAEIERRAKIWNAVNPKATKAKKIQPVEEVKAV